MPLGTKDTAEKRREEFATLAKEIAGLKVDTTSIPSRDKIVERLTAMSKEKPPTPAEQTAAVREE